MRDHTKLKAFGLADRLVLETYNVTRRFPEEERFGLCSQMRRAAVSIGTNIVEAAARPSQGEYLRLLSVAYSSAKELQYEISIAARLNYLDPDAEKDLSRHALETSKALWALIAAIRRAGSR